jgi:hypothetical protein
MEVFSRNHLRNANEAAGWPRVFRRNTLSAPFPGILGLVSREVATQKLFPCVIGSAIASPLFWRNSMAQTLKDKISSLELKLKQAKALAAKQSAKEQAAKIKQDRLLDARRKLLVGAFMLQGGDPLLLVNGQGQTLDLWLTRPDERALFMPDPLPVTESPTSPATDAPNQAV